MPRLDNACDDFPLEPSKEICQLIVYVDILHFDVFGFDLSSDKMVSNPTCFVR